MATDEKRKPTLADIERLMDNSYTLCYVFPDDNLRDNLHIISKCIETGNAEPLSEAIDEWYEVSRHDALSDEIRKLKCACIDDGFGETATDSFFDEHDDCIRMMILDRDDSFLADDLCRNTGWIPIRIEMLSGYDCINSHWLESSGGYYYENSYFGHMVDALNLNPQKVKEILLANGVKVAGNYPDIRTRDGKEQVSYDDFYRELCNSCCGANLLTYIGKMDVRDLLNVDFNIASVVIPKGNVCGLFCAMQGGGSLMDMKLLTDVEIALKTDGYDGFRLRIDACDTYPLKSVYAVLDSFFGQNIQLNRYEKQL